MCGNKKFVFDINGVSVLERISSPKTRHLRLISLVTKK